MSKMEPQHAAPEDVELVRVEVPDGRFYEVDGREVAEDGPDGFIIYPWVDEVVREAVQLAI